MDNWTKRQWSKELGGRRHIAPQRISGFKGPFLDSPVADLSLSLRDGRASRFV
jgi:hypothetical protein